MDEGPASEIHLGSMLTEKAIKVRVRVKSWEEAVGRAGEILVEDGAVEDRYIEAMRRVLKEMGPYAVIAPGIVLLHARPEDGVNRPCLAVMTLETPVPFGHSQNDPVDLVVAFGAVDKKAHLSALQELARVLSDQAAVKRIRTAPDCRAVLAIVRSFVAEPGPRSEE